MMRKEITHLIKNKTVNLSKPEVPETHHHSHEHTHPHSCSCEIRKPRTTLLDRALMLFLAIVISFFIFKPFLSFQSYMRGYQYTEAGRPDLAIKHLKRAVRMDESNALAWSLLGYSYLKTGDKESAIKAYAKALSLNPEDVQAAIEVSLIYLNEGNFKKAASTLETYLKKDSRYTNGWILLASTYEKAGETEKAVKTWKTIYKEIDPGNAVAKDKLTQLMRKVKK